MQLLHSKFIMSDFYANVNSANGYMTLVILQDLFDTSSAIKAKKN